MEEQVRRVRWLARTAAGIALGDQPAARAALEDFARRAGRAASMARVLQIAGERLGPVLEALPEVVGPPPPAGPAPAEGEPFGAVYREVYGTVGLVGLLCGLVLGPEAPERAAMTWGGVRLWQARSLGAADAGLDLMFAAATVLAKEGWCGQRGAPQGRRGPRPARQACRREPSDG